MIGRQPLPQSGRTAKRPGTVSGRVFSGVLYRAVPYRDISGKTARETQRGDRLCSLEQAVRAEYENCVRYPAQLAGIDRFISNLVGRELRVSG